MTTATVVEECQCVSDCYRKSFYEKATRVPDGPQEVVVHNLISYLRSSSLTCLPFSTGNRCRRVRRTLLCYWAVLT